MRYYKISTDELGQVLASNAFRYSSIWIKMCRGARQGVFVKDECVSWYSEVGVPLLLIEDRSEVKWCP